MVSCSCNEPRVEFAHSSRDVSLARDERQKIVIGECNFCYYFRIVGERNREEEGKEQEKERSPED